MKKCKLCSAKINDSDWDICEDCIEKAKTIENVIKIGNCWTEEVRVNGFLRFCFTEREIENIILEKFNSFDDETKKLLISGYCDEDMLYFVRWIEKNGEL